MSASCPLVAAPSPSSSCQDRQCHWSHIQRQKVLKSLNPYLCIYIERIIIYIYVFDYVDPDLKQLGKHDST